MSVTQKPEYFDVIIVGAGMSGVGSAYHLRDQCPGTSFLILEEMESFGGTWLTHTYPGVRSGGPGQEQQPQDETPGDVSHVFSHSHHDHHVTPYPVSFFLIHAGGSPGYRLQPLQYGWDEFRDRRVDVHRARYDSIRLARVHDVEQ